jgi:plastocyanin/nitrate reductase cytochrome c-type subunit
MFKRVTIVALVVAAFLVLAVPAMAFSGYRDDYSPAELCTGCHPAVAGEWSETGHAVAGSHGQGARLPYGSSCGGCHTGNYDPSKVVPTPTSTTVVGSPTPTATTVRWGAMLPDDNGDMPYTEPFVGCSSCHYGASTTHAAPNQNLANAEICGQCHNRYSYTVDTYEVAPVPYLALDGSGSPIPNPSPTTLLQPQYAIGYNPLGESPDWMPAGLGTVLNVQTPGWDPTPDPAATSPAGLQTYWQIDGEDTVWQYRGHDGASNQYADWAVEGHATALDDLKAVMGPNPPARCLECHSADYRIAVEAGKTPPTGAEAKYGITCVGCHTPHENGTATGEWSEEFHPQLITDSQKTLCVECHNGEIPEGTEAVPGSAIHHPMKEMIDGYGAVDVPAFPSVHKDKCVQCHMPPTTTSPTGGNHTFKIIEPEMASEAVPNPLVTNSPTPTMPYSSCSGAKGCHTRPNEPYGLYLQDTIEQRQEWTHAKIEQIWTRLDTAAVNMGYADIDEAVSTLNAKAMNTWTTAERALLSGFTNVEFVEAEGSFGLHNWDYSRAIVNTAMSQAKIAETGVVVRMPWKVTFKMSKTNIRAGTKVKYSGTVKTSKGVAATGKVKIMKRVGGVWKVWKSASVKANGSYSLTVKMTKKGKFYMRAFMPADDLNLSAYSRPNIKLVVK